MNNLYNTLVLSLMCTSIAISASQSGAQELNPRVDFGEVDCYQISNKQFYSDGEVDNTAMDSKPIKIKSIQQGTHYPLLINGDSYEYSSGVSYTGSDGVPRFNILYTQKSPNLLATKTASMLIYNGNQELKFHMVFVEPLMGNRRSFVRTSFYNCN